MKITVNTLKNLKEICLNLICFYKELFHSPNFLSPIAETVLSLSKVGSLSQMQKENPAFYLFYIFLLENFYESIYFTKAKDIFKPEIYKVNEFLESKYILFEEKFRVEKKNFGIFYEKMEEFFDKIFSYFIGYWIYRKENLFQKSTQKIHVKHLDLSTYVIKTGENTNIIGFSMIF